MDDVYILRKASDESTNSYIDRVCNERINLKLTWKELSTIINQQTGLHYDESHYRKNWQRKQEQEKQCNIDSDVKEVSDNNSEIDESNTEESDEERKLKALLSTIKKERMKVSDQRIQGNAEFRRVSREETIKEIAHDYAVQMNSKKILLPTNQCPCSNNNSTKAILQISDWHYGIVIDNFWNRYDTDIAKKRVSVLRDIVINRIKQNNVSDLYVVNLADLICGRIHLPLRLQSRVDVITQIMQVTEVLAELIASLSKYTNIHYYDCIDNHSRLEPNKADSLDLESLVRITPWYLKERLEQFGNIDFHENIYGPDIISFNIDGFQIAGVHGDRDKPQDVVDRISMMTHSHYDLILTAHLHHFSCDEKNETLVVSNGSLMGTDEYAKSLRLSNMPSQNMVIVTKNNVADTIYRIPVKSEGE